MILAEGGLTTPWESIRSVGARGGGAGDDRHRGVGGRRRRAPRTCCWTSAGGRAAHRRRAGPDRLGRGLLGAAQGAAAAAARRPAGGGVRLQRRAGRDPRRRPGRAIGADLVGAAAAHRLRAGARRPSVGLAVGYAGAWGVRRIALPSSGLYPLAVLALCVTAYGAAAVAHGSGFLAVYLAALVLGNVAAAAPVGHPRLRRGRRAGWPRSGCSSCSGCWRPRPSCGPSILPGPRRRPGAAAASPGRCRCWRRCCRSSCGCGAGTSRRPGANGCCCPGPGCAGRCRSCWRRCPRDDDVFNLVFVLVVVFTLVQAPTLPWVARRLGVTAEGEAQQPGHRVLAADPAGRRPAAGARRRGVAPGRGRGRRAAACRSGAAVTLVVRAGQAFVPRPARRCRSATTCILVHDRVGAQRGGATAARRVARRPAGRLEDAPTAGPDGEHGQQRLHQRADRERVDARCRRPSVPPSSQPVATTATSMPVRTSRTDRPVRRDQTGHQAVARPGPELHADVGGRWRRRSAARRRRPGRDPHGQRVDGAGSTASVASTASPITTTLLTVPTPGRCRSGIQQQQHERADDDRDRCRASQPRWRARPWCSTSHGMTPEREPHQQRHRDAVERQADVELDEPAGQARGRSAARRGDWSTATSHGP